jgi:hypothetical protein
MPLLKFVNKFDSDDDHVMCYENRDDSIFAGTRKIHVKFEIFTAVTMKNTVFWYVEPCISCANRRFLETYRLHLQGRKIRERGTSVSRWLQRMWYNLCFPVYVMLDMYE